MTEEAMRSQVVHRWYTRPVLFVARVLESSGRVVETLDIRVPDYVALAETREGERS